MDVYTDIMRAERSRTMRYGAELDECCEIRCPVCNSAEWEYLFRDNGGDIVGCQECVSKIYPDELTSHDSEFIYGN